ncbi:hypothetical protein CBY09_22345 [Acidovorax kalamii]|uniref:Uncharacterized protein n=1 Tax=Acidovorax kalamii TaxID=2004485 RepID=A0A235EG52_9BURK|nr:hypothetical protein CBY09_22345 [Acidovorax kalamii]
MGAGAARHEGADVGDGAAMGAAVGGRGGGDGRLLECNPLCGGGLAGLFQKTGVSGKYRLLIGRYQSN